MANTDKNNGIMYVIRVNKKPELMGQSVYDVDGPSVMCYFHWLIKRLPWPSDRTEN